MIKYFIRALLEIQTFTPFSHNRLGVLYNMKAMKQAFPFGIIFLGHHSFSEILGVTYKRNI